MKTLRSRIVLAITGATFLFSLTFACIIYIVLQATESGLLTHHQQWVDNYEAHFNEYQHIPPPEFVRLLKADGNNALPPYLNTLNEGEHEIHNELQTLNVFVRQINHAHWYFIFDITAFEKREMTTIAMLAVSVALLTVLAWVASARIANMILTPLSQLARAVDPAYADQDRPAADDEVKMLASAINRYQRTVADTLTREKHFTADASHEFRTPLTVISGASEILAGTSLDHRQKTQLNRITKSVSEMQHLLDALLHLARTPGHKEADITYSLTEVVSTQIARHQHILNEHEIDLTVDMVPDCMISGHPTAINVVIANLIKNAFSYTAQGAIRIAAKDGTFTITNTLNSSTLPNWLLRWAQSRQDRDTFPLEAGIGLTIVKRLCDQNNWPLLAQSSDPASFSITINFPISPA